MANERRFAMGAAVGLRDDYEAETLRGLARASSDAGQVQRLLALAAIYAGGTRGEAAAIGGVGLQTIRDWVLRFNSEGPCLSARPRHHAKDPSAEAAFKKISPRMWRRSRRVRLPASQ
jgi:transposase